MQNRQGRCVMHNLNSPTECSINHAHKYSTNFNNIANSCFCLLLFLSHTMDDLFGGNVSSESEDEQEQRRNVPKIGQSPDPTASQDALSNASSSTRKRYFHVGFQKMKQNCYKCESRYRNRGIKIKIDQFYLKF